MLPALLALLATSPLPGAVPPPAVAALLPAGRRVVEAREGDLDGDGRGEWVLVASFDDPGRADRGPRSDGWRSGDPITTRRVHELLVVGWQRGEAAIRHREVLAGNEPQPLFLRPLSDAAGAAGPRPVVVAGVRACLGACGPVEVHLVAWNPRRRAFETWAWVGAEFAVLSRAGTVDLWFADRRPGDPICCPSGYTVEQVGMAGDGIESLRQASVPAERLHRLPPPGRLIHREED